MIMRNAVKCIEQEHNVINSKKQHKESSTAPEYNTLKCHAKTERIWDPFHTKVPIEKSHLEHVE